MLQIMNKLSLVCLKLDTKSQRTPPILIFPSYPSMKQTVECLFPHSHIVSFSLIAVGKTFSVRLMNTTEELTRKSVTVSGEDWNCCKAEGHTSKNGGKAGYWNVASFMGFVLPVHWIRSCKNGSTWLCNWRVLFNYLCTKAKGRLTLAFPDFSSPWLCNPNGVCMFLQEICNVGGVCVKM